MDSSVLAILFQLVFPADQARHSATPGSHYFDWKGFSREIQGPAKFNSLKSFQWSSYLRRCFQIRPTLQEEYRQHDILSSQHFRSFKEPGGSPIGSQID